MNINKWLLPVLLVIVFTGAILLSQGLRLHDEVWGSIIGLGIMCGSYFVFRVLGKNQLLQNK